MKEKKLLALVQWIGGKYDRTYTAGVPAEWIKDFDPETFTAENQDPDESYVIEWRSFKKNKPKNGWKYYDARIISVSKKIKTLEKTLSTLDGQVSPLKITIKHAEKNQISGPKTSSTVLNSLKRNLSAETSSYSWEDNRERNGDSSKKNKYQKLHVNRQADANETENEELSDGTEIAEMNQDVNEDDRDNGEISNATESDTTTKKILILMLKELQAIKKKQNANENMANNQRNENNDAQHELGHVGSNIFVTNKSWRLIQTKLTYQSMGIALVKASFPQDVLLESNLRGNSSKINKNADKRPGLNPETIAAIEETVYEKFPDCKKSILGAAINNFLCDLRRKNKAKALNIEEKDD